MENKSRLYWIVGLIAAGGVVLSLIVGAIAGGAAGYFVGRRAANPSLRANWIIPWPFGGQTEPVQPTPVPQPRRQQPPAQVPPAEALVTAELTTVVEDGPAATAGLQVGDLITAVDRQRVTLMNDLSQLIRQHKPGDTVTIQYLRGGKEQSVQVRLGAREGQPNVPYLGVEYRMNLQGEGE